MRKAGIIMRTIGVLVFTLTATVFAQKAASSKPVGCESRKYELTKPQDFLINLYCIAKRGRKDLWSDQLSKERQARGNDYLSQHFEAWSQEIVRLVEKNFGGDVNSIETETIKPQEGQRYVIRVRNPTAKPGSEFEALIKVIMEGGRLRIDED